MSNIFLGRWWHWLLLVLVIGLLWAAGENKMHVIRFNLFVTLLVVGTAVSIIALIRTTQLGDRITRDPIVDDVNDD